MTINQIPHLTPRQRDTLKKIQIYPYNMMYDVLDDTSNTDINPQIAYRVGWLLYDSLSVKAVNNIVDNMNEDEQQFIYSFYASGVKNPDELTRNIPEKESEIKMWKKILEYLQQDSCIECIQAGKKYSASTSASAISSQLPFYRRLLSIMLTHYYSQNNTSSEPETENIPVSTEIIPDTDLIESDTIITDDEFETDFDTEQDTSIKDEIARILSDEDCIKGLKHILTQMPNEMYSVIGIWQYNITDNDAVRILNISRKNIDKLRTKTIEYLLDPQQRTFIVKGYKQGVAYLKELDRLRKEEERKIYKYLTDVPVTILYEICNLPAVIRLRKYVEEHLILNVDQISRLTDDELRQSFNMKDGTAVVQNIRNGILWVRQLCETNRLRDEQNEDC